MQRTVFNNRKAVQIETGLIRVTVTEEGGHIAEILNKTTGVNPLWIPPWPSIEPSTWSEVTHPEYGPWPEAMLFSGIMGHNLCVNVFGMPSATEQAAGVCIHGEAGIVPWNLEACPTPISSLAKASTTSAARQSE